MEAREPEAQKLRLIRAYLLMAMTEHSADFAEEAQPFHYNSKALDAAPNARCDPSFDYVTEGKTYHLDEIDPEFPKRKIARAIDEVRAALYPDESANPAFINLTQQKRSAVVTLLTMSGVEKVQKILAELDALHQLAEMVEENLLEVFKTVPEGYTALWPENSTGAQGAIKDAAGAAADIVTRDSVAQLWFLLLGLARDFLKPDAVISKVITGEWSAEDARRHPQGSDAKQAFHDFYTARSEDFCNRLKQNDLNQKETVSNAWKTLGQTSAPRDSTTVFAQIHAATDRLVLAAWKLFDQGEQQEEQQEERDEHRQQEKQKDPHENQQENQQKDQQENQQKDQQEQKPDEENVNGLTLPGVLKTHAFYTEQAPLIKTLRQGSSPAMPVPSIPLAWVGAHKQMPTEQQMALQIKSVSFSAESGVPKELETASGTDETLSCCWIARAFKEMDASLYSLEQAANLQSRNPVALVHINPVNITLGYSSKKAEDKLAGDALGSFGGFLKSSWRANDILWGRLDAAYFLADTLLDQERLARIVRADPNFVADILQALDAYVYTGIVVPPPAQKTNNKEIGSLAAGPTDAAPIEPGAGTHTFRRDDIGCFLVPGDATRELSEYSADRQTIEHWLRKLVKLKMEDLPPIGNSPELTLLLKWILKRHQVEIIVKEVPGALTQALVENSLWQGEGLASDRDKVRGLGDNAASGATLTPLEVPKRMARMTHALAQLGGNHPDDAVRGVLTAQATRWIETLFAGASSPVDCNPAATRASKLVQFLEKDYAIGEEDAVKNIPPLVSLQRVISLVLILLHVVDNCLSDKFRESSPGRMLTRGLLSPLTLVVGLLYSLIVTLTEGKTVRIGVLAVCVTVVIMGIYALFLKFSVPLLIIVLVAALFLFLILKLGRR